MGYIQTAAGRQTGKGETMTPDRDWLKLDLYLNAEVIEHRFDDIYRAYVKRIYRYCLFRTNSYQDAEDITADVFIKLLGDHQTPAKSDYLLPWLFKVAGNLCLNHNHRRKQGQLLEKQAQINKDHVEQPWGYAVIWQAIANLKPTQQQVIYLNLPGRDAPARHQPSAY